MPAPTEKRAVDPFLCCVAISRCIWESSGQLSIDEQSRTTNGVSLGFVEEQLKIKAASLLFNIWGQKNPIFTFLSKEYIRMFETMFENTIKSSFWL